MKKLFTMIMMAVVLFTACTNEDEPTVEQIVTIQATIAHDSRVALGDTDEKKVNWTAGDIINLTINEIAYSFTWQEGTTFAYTGNASLPSLTPGTQITATYVSTINATQSGLKEDVGRYMALSATETVQTELDYNDLNLTFSHRTSVLKLTLSNKDFKGADVTDITLKAGGTVVATATNTFRGDGGTGSVTAYLAINPTTLNNVTLQATCGGNNYFGTLTNKELTSGKLYNATATLANACFLPDGSTFKTEINNFLGNNPTLDKIKFVAGPDDPTWTPPTENPQKVGDAYMVANASTNTLEIRTATSCFVFNEDCSNMFCGETNWTKNNIGKKITSIDLGECINTSNVTTMSGMFSYCYELQSISISNFSTSSVTDMDFMFYYCQKLQSLVLSSFNTSNVTNMRGMFAFCNQLKSLSFGNNFNTANVIDMGYMFQYINKSNSSATLDLDLTGFEFKSGVDIDEIFQGAGQTKVRVENQTDYEFLKTKKTYYITFVQSDGNTTWE